MSAVTPGDRLLRRPPAAVTDLLLHLSKEARRRDRADERLFGRLGRDTWHCRGNAFDSRQLARDLHRVRPSFSDDT
jgi:hypothetical protein